TGGVGGPGLVDAFGAAAGAGRAGCAAAAVGVALGASRSSGRWSAAPLPPRGDAGLGDSAAGSLAGEGGNLWILSKHQVRLWTFLLVSGFASWADDGGRSGNPSCMNIVAKSRTGRGCAIEFVAASAKARPLRALGLVLGLALGLAGCSSTLSEMPT